MQASVGFAAEEATPALLRDLHTSLVYVNPFEEAGKKRHQAKERELTWNTRIFSLPREVSAKRGRLWRHLRPHLYPRGTPSRRPQVRGSEARLLRTRVTQGRKICGTFSSRRARGDRPVSRRGSKSRDTDTPPPPTGTCGAREKAARVSKARFIALLSALTLGAEGIMRKELLRALQRSRPPTSVTSVALVTRQVWAPIHLACRGSSPCGPPAEKRAALSQKEALDANYSEKRAEGDLVRCVGLMRASARLPASPAAAAATDKQGVKGAREAHVRLRRRRKQARNRRQKGQSARTRARRPSSSARVSTGE